MKKVYTSPVAKLFDVSAEEKIAASCGNHLYNLAGPAECLLTANTGNCVIMMNQDS